jgi:hypothetical protein
MSGKRRRMVSALMPEVVTVVVVDILRWVPVRVSGIERDVSVGEGGKCKVDSGMSSSGA